VRGAGKAVGAAVFAATVGIHARLESHVGAVVATDDGLRGVPEEFGAR
jgi:hypothetical protein